MIGLVQLGLIGALVSGLGMAGVGVWRYHAGQAAGHTAAATERNAHWQGVVTTLQTDHRKAVDAANARALADEESWRLARLGAERAQERERAANRTALAAVAAERDGLRDALARAATGGIAAADDTVGACRERADALGRVLGEVLRDSAACAADAEDLAAGVRALRAAWPVSAAEAR